MQFLDEISTTGSLKTYKVKESRTVADLLGDIGLESKFFAILADGKKVGLNDKIDEGQEITILPKIAGGM